MQLSDAEIAAARVKAQEAGDRRGPEESPASGTFCFAPASLATSADKGADRDKIQAGWRLWRISQLHDGAPDAEYLRAVLRNPVYEAVQKTPLQKMDSSSQQRQR